MSDPNSNAVVNPLSRLPQTLSQLYTARYNSCLTRIALYETQLAALLVSPVESYSFSAGEGQQQAKRRDLKQVQRALSHEERMAEFYWKKCNGWGMTNLTLRRR